MTVHFSLQQFTRTQTLATTTLTACASDLGFRAGQEPLCQIYPDACDAGFFLHSPVTGRSVRFYLTEAEENDGDLIAWHFAPTSDTLRQCPALRNWKATIYND